MTKLLFLDTETTGLDLERHEVWEVGAILREDDKEDVEYHWFLHVSLTRADPIALDIGRFWERHPSALAKTGQKELKETALQVDNESAFAHEFFKLSYKAHIVGAVPDFDCYRIAPILRRNGCLPMWHYHLVCCENLAAGHLRMQPPWKSDEIFGKLGIDKEKYERHTALGDARMVRDVYDLVMGGTNELKSVGYRTFIESDNPCLDNV